MDRKELTRRQLLREAAGLAAAATTGAVLGCNADMLFPSPGGQWSTSDPLCAAEGDDGGGAEAGVSTVMDSGLVTAPPPVVSVQRDTSVLLNSAGIYTGVDPTVVASMLDVGLKQLAASVAGTAAGSVSNPWTVLLPTVTKHTRIGLKVNGLNANLPTHAELVSAIISSLASYLPVDPSTIVVWDFLASYLKGSGYSATAFSGAQILGTLASSTDTSGPGYRQNPCATIPGQISSTPRLSSILTDHTDLTINLPVLKVHMQAGVTGAMKNVYGMIDIPSSYHAPVLNTALPLIYNLPPIRNSIRLTILDALEAVIVGDTDWRPTATPGAILMSQDPLALDCYCVDYMNTLKAANSYTPVQTALLGWIANAAQLGIGASQYNLINV